MGAISSRIKVMMRVLPYRKHGIKGAHIRYERPGGNYQTSNQ
jgi:hypothetical protein